MSFQRSEIFGFDFICAGGPEEVTEDIFALTRRDVGKPVFLITPNAYTIVHYLDSANEEVYRHYQRADFILPDGIPIVWLSKFLKVPTLPARLTGSDLFPIVWDGTKREGYNVSLVLPKDNMVDLFQRDYPNCISHVPVFFDPDDDLYINQFSEEVAEGIIENNSRFLFLGLNFPKQEKIGIRVAEKLTQKGYKKGVLILLLGASFEFYFNLKKRAPKFYRKTGLEWLHRFITEPRRLWKRYTIDIVRFLWLAIKEILFASPKKARQ